MDAPLIYIWHSETRAALTGERLYYWRFAVDNFDTQTIVRRISTFLARHEPPCRSFAIYETFGDWDVLLRCWLPRSVSPDAFELALLEALSPLAAENPQYMAVHEVLRHHAFADLELGDDISLPPLDIADIDVRPIEHHNATISAAMEAQLPRPEDEPIRYGAGPSPAVAEAAKEAIGSGYLAPLLLGHHGIRFYVTLGYPRVPLHLAQRRDLNRRLVRTCERVLAETRASDPTANSARISVYSGYGTLSTHLITAQAPDRHFYSFSRRLLRALHDEGLMATHQMKPITTVYAHRDATMIYESLLPTPGRQITADDLDDLREDESLEVKASVWLDARGLLQSQGRHRSFGGGPEAVAKAACGMLNRTGGVLVVGTGEVARLASDEFPLMDVHEAVEALSLPLNDSGALVVFGLEEEYKNPESTAEDWDSWLRNVIEYLAAKIQPNPVHTFSLNVKPLQLPAKYGSRTLGIIEITPPRDRTWFYFNDQFFVRYEGSTRLLRGKQMDEYRRALLDQVPDGV